MENVLLGRQLTGGGHVSIVIRLLRSEMIERET